MKRLLPTISIICLCITISAQTLTLDSCLQLAQSNNLQIKNAQLGIQQAQQIRYQVITKFFPNIQARALGFHALNPLLEIGAQDIINAVNDPQTRSDLNQLYQEYGNPDKLEKMFSFLPYGVTAGVIAIQPIFAGGQIINSTQLANLGVEVARLNATLTERNIQQEVEQTYITLVGLEDKKTTLLSVIALLDTLSRDVNSAINAGLTTGNDLLKIELQRSETLKSQLQLENGIMLARQALCMQIGLPYTDSLTIDKNSVYILHTDSMPRPEYELLEINVRAEQLKKKIEIGKALPQIAVGGTYSYNRFFKDRNQHNGLLFATIQIPLTDWWETAHKIKESNLATEQAENNRTYLNEQMQLQTLQTQQDLLLAEQQIHIAEKAINNATENLRIALINYRAGLLPISELLEARTLLSQAENELIDAQLAQRLAQRKAENCK